MGKGKIDLKVLNPGAPNAFSTIQGDAGTSPTADSGTDTLTISSSDSSITVTGDSSTDTIDLVASVADATDTVKGVASFDENDFTVTSGDVALSSNVQDILHARNGSIIETIANTVTSDGVTITFSLEQSGGGDLTLYFSDGFSTFDTTPAATVSLTAGSDTSPQINYIFIPQSTKTLTANTTGFPSTEHAPVATALCQSAASLQTDNAFKVHTWNDHSYNRTSNQGHESHVNAWIRQQEATWISGVALTPAITTNGGSADNFDIAVASGTVLQLHNQTMPALDTGVSDAVWVVNHPTTAYTRVTDLNTQLTDSENVSMSGKRFNLVIWGVASSPNADSKLFCNLPNASYNADALAIADDNNTANYTIPTQFKGTAFLIARLTVKHTVASGGTWEILQNEDLRGQQPGAAAGGSGTTKNEYEDNVFKILDEGDNTKVMQFQASGITTATTRTLTIPDKDGTIATTADTIAIANGGTGQTSQTEGFDALAPTTTKGDVIVSNGTDNIRVAVGTNDQVLTADSAEASGVKWADAGGGGTPNITIAELNASTATTRCAGSQVIDYNNVLYDTGSHITADTGSPVYGNGDWIYTCDATGYYQVAVLFECGGAASGAANAYSIADLEIDTGGGFGFHKRLVHSRSWASATVEPVGQGTTHVYLTSGDKLRVKYQENWSAAYVTFTTSAGRNLFSIAKVGVSDLGAGTVFVDGSGFQITGSADATKIVEFEVDGLTTATTRTLTVPDASGTLLLASGSQNINTSGTLDVQGAVSLDGGSFVFNESSIDVDFRCESNIHTHVFSIDGGSNSNVTIGTTANYSTGKLNVITHSTANKEVLYLNQTDTSEGMIRYDVTGGPAAGTASAITSWTTGNTIQGFVKVRIGTTYRWMPYYDDPTS